MTRSRSFSGNLGVNPNDNFVASDGRIQAAIRIPNLNFSVLVWLSKARSHVCNHHEHNRLQKDVQNPRVESPGIVLGKAVSKSSKSSRMM